MRIEGINSNPTAPVRERLVTDKIIQRRVDPRKLLSAGSESLRDRQGSEHEEIEEQVEQLNGILRTFDRQLAFELHEETNRHIVRIIDVNTDDVLREIPPEEVLDLVARIEDLVGLLIDEKI